MLCGECLFGLIGGEMLKVVEVCWLFEENGSEVLYVECFDCFVVGF